MDKSASAEELSELEAFLRQDPQYDKLYNTVSALKGQTDAVVDETGINNRIDTIWTKIRDTETTTVFNYRKWIGIAATVAIFAGVGLLFYKNVNQKGKQPVNVSMLNIDVPFGKLIELTLPDGTKVKLNSGSHFSYPSGFPGAQREVNLDGEAFFNVKNDAEKTFLVHTQGLTVRVLGTTFNVKAYLNDKKTETTLLTGKVQVELANDPEKKIILSPHEKLTVNNQITSDTASVFHPDVAKVKYAVATLAEEGNEVYQENAWISNKMIFNNNDFEDVARQMERKYNIKIVFEDESLKAEQISGVLENETPDKALIILKQIIPFKSRINGNTVYLSRR